MYYNTNSLSGDPLKVAGKKTLRQEDLVKEIFIKFRRKFTASDIAKRFPKNVPITSVRRAMTNLKNEGFLERLDKVKEGVYGSPEHYYEIDPEWSPYKQMKMF